MLSSSELFYIKFLLYLDLLRVPSAPLHLLADEYVAKLRWIDESFLNSLTWYESILSCYCYTFGSIHLITKSFLFLIISLQWLAVVSLAVFYNVIFVIGRSVFWEINYRAPGLWFTLDYLCDFIYLIDTLVHCHEGKLIIFK